MFDKLIRELKRLDKATISIPIHADKDGYIDRECPSEECLFQFKVHEEDWKEKVRDEEVFCPMCRYTDTADSWFTSEQQDNAREQAAKYIKGLTGAALREGAKDFNRKQSRNSFIRLSASVKGPSAYYILPIPSQEEMERKIESSACHTRYAVIGSAFFCPCCGHNSVEETFDNSVASIRSTIGHIPEVHKSLAIISKDEAINTCRSLIEKSLLDCVVSFQRFCEVVYRKHPNAKAKVPFNAFQKLDVGGELWSDIFGESYTDWLSGYEYQRLNILFQRRHLLQHTEGIVDDKYITKTNDCSYNVNQRIVIKEKDVLELVGYVSKLVNNIKSHL